MSRLERRNYGRGHGYLLDGQKVTGVTTALDVLDKPALKQWFANQAAERAVNEWDRLVDMQPMERFEFIKWGPRDRVRQAALRGTEIHELGEKVAHGGTVDVPDEHRGPVEAYARFLDEWQVDVIATETPLAHEQFGYAGTADVWATIGRLGDARVLLDVKTGNGVYEEVARQLAGYRWATLWQPDGPLTPAERAENTKRRRKGEPELEPREEPMPEWDECYVAWVRPDHVQLLPIRVEEHHLTELRYCLALTRAIARDKDDTPVGAALQLHDYPDERTTTDE